MKKNLRMRDRYSPNLPRVQCRRMPITVDNQRSISVTDTGSVVISGYAVKWDSINYYGEKFIKGAFAEVCARFASGEQKIHAYYNHGWRTWYVDAQLAMRIGKWLQFKEDDIGLFVELEFTKGLPIADMVAAMVLHGTIDGFSISFYEPKSDDVVDKGAYVEILKANIYETSVVDEPADDAARIIDDQTIDAIESVSDAETLLRSILPNGYGEKLLARLAEIEKPKPKIESNPDPFEFLDQYTA
ncbi:HK97 family phage prohead protease [Acinetobacter bereziniae]|uniref:HK97 family phage prohead protease n=1 Tax=Acinetobacter bereziniae TaxID=106648 RepID=UPI001905205B|nr:HK97 family phage prohead protease [Acinetobacter bereziniae]QQC84633.1 HK97 family phage prohead protease [Acinetobacter bereziniae]